jgi:hypothetical protein
MKDLPDPGEEDVEQNGCPAHTTHESQSKKNNRERNDPVDVLCKVDLIRQGTAEVELRGDDRVGNSRRHGEVGDCSDEECNGEEVVEDPLVVARLEAEGEVGELLIAVLVN